MYRLLLVGLLLFTIPAVIVAQEDKEKGKDAATDKGVKDGDKAKADSSGEVEVMVHRTWLDRVADVGAKIAGVLGLVFLCFITLLLMGLRSDIGQLLEKIDKGGPS
jgi:hypothetical protein